MSELKYDDVKHGQVVFICDFRQCDLNKKPIRSMPVTEVIACNNSELPKHKIIYYSDYHFRTLKKDREPSSKIIPVFDNTGYRGFTGIPVNIFTTKSECVKRYIEQCNDVIERLSDKKASALNEIQDQIDKVSQLIAQT